MGLFQQITNTDHLPPVGNNAENLTLDIKAVDNSTPFERAKDVAAFANASGGVILVGAHEDRTNGSVRNYVPMEHDKAKQIRDAFTRATRDRCSPKPVINPAIITYQDKFVVAINVWPFPGQAVGVRRDDDGPLSFAFPFRTGVDTIWLNAEQLPMLMVPELRRITILLDAIPKDAKIGILAPEGHVRVEVFHVELRALDNVVEVEQRHAHGRNYTTYLPIDEIRSVWKQPNGEWRMIVKGDMRDAGGEFIYQTAIPSR